MNEAFTDKIGDLVRPLLEKQGVELVDLIVVRGYGRSTLRFLVDLPGGITLDRCVQLNEEIGKALDRENAIQESYILEVASPGLDRPLVSTRDFQRCAQKKLRIILHQPIDRQNVWKGTMSEVDEANLTIQTEDQKTLVIPRNNIAKARLEI